MSLFSKNIGIDLGTANTFVYVGGKGIVVNEPTVVAINQKTNSVVAIGAEAKEMIGRTPSYIYVVRPLVNGVISDFEVTAELLKYFLNKVLNPSVTFLTRSRVVVGIPTNLTEVEKKAVKDAVLNAGAKEVYLIEETLAGAIGIRLPIFESSGSMVIDIGGGTSDIAVISLGGIVVGKSINIAGDKFNSDIINYVKDELKLLIGERMAEEIKILVGALGEQKEIKEGILRGRDLITGLPKEVVINSNQIEKAMVKSIKILINAIKSILEETPPELVADIINKGIYLVGGGSLLKGINKIIAGEVQIPVHIAEDPLTAVARGAGAIVEDFKKYKEVLIKLEEE